MESSGSINLSLEELADLLKEAAELGREASDTWGSHTESGIAYKILCEHFYI